MRSTGCLNAGFGGFMTVAELVRSNDLCAHTIAALNGGSAVRPDTTRPCGPGGRFETRWSRNAQAHSTSGLENSLRLVHRTALGRSGTDAFADSRRCSERPHFGWTRGRSRPGAVSRLEWERTL